MKPKTYVFYHNNCFDGMGAAWVAMKYAVSTETTSHILDSWEFVSMNYDSELPDIEPKSTVYFVDYSRNDLQDYECLINGLNCDVILLDHHKSAIDNLEQNHANYVLPENKFHTVLDVNRSGAGIAWDYFFPNQPIPRFLAYIQDRDLWRFELEDSRQINAYISTIPLNFENYSRMFLEFQDDESFSKVRTKGEIVLQVTKNNVETICKKAHILELDNYQEIVVANSSLYMSEIGEHLLDQHKAYDMAGYYFTREDGKVQVGLRSRTTSEVDVAEFAEKFGGGGHKNAAGFVLDPETLYKNLRTLATVLLFWMLTILPAQAFTQIGEASWYGPGFHGKRTANGERFDQNGLTAAHCKLPFGSKVRVTHLKNKKSVVVRINDRGGFCKYRIIDLSKGAAKALGISGVGRVRLDLVK